MPVHTSTAILIRVNTILCVGLISPREALPQPSASTLFLARREVPGKVRHTELFRTMRSRDHDVVIVRRTINLGTGNLECGGVEKGEVSLQVT
jgi:hypothetical protein